MASGRRITIEFLGKDTSASSTAIAVEKKFGKLGGSLDKVGQASGKLLAGGLIAGGAAMVKFGDKASDLAETQNKVNQIFGEDSAKALDKFAGGAATAMGQSKQQALDAAATFGVFGKSAGLAGDDLVGFSSDMTTLASDMASFNNTDPQEAIDAIGAALRGESEPIRRFGVLLDDATLKSEAMKLGLIKTTKQALTPQQKVLAAQSAIMKQTADQQGDFARTSDGLANKQRILKARMENLGAAVGKIAVPAMQKLTDAGLKAVGWISQHQRLVGTLVVVFGGLAGVLYTVSAAMRAYLVITKATAAVTGAYRAAKQALVFWTYSEQAATLRATASTIAHKVAVVASSVAMKAAALASKAWAAATWLVNVALKAVMANPIVFLLSALAIGLVVAYKKSETFRRIVNAAFHAVGAAAKAAFGFVVRVATGAFQWIKGNWPKLLAILTGPIGIAVLVIAKNWDKIKAGASRVKDWIVDQFNAVVGFFRSIPGRISSAASGMWDGIKNSFKSAINTIIGWWNNLSFSINIPDGIPGLPDSFSINTPNIPYLARGTASFGGGLAVVGERGPELVNLPRGTSVTPAGRTADLLGGGVNIIVQGNLFGDARAIARELERLLRAEERRSGRKILLGS